MILICLALLTAGTVACDNSGDKKKTEDPYVARNTLPNLPDWTCPAGWTSTPGFVDADGNENVPEGLTQFNRCAPPASWAGPNGPVELESWVCPAGWVTIEHATLLDKNGNPFSWCEPPRVARIFSPGDADDGTDYLTPVPEGTNPDDFEQCDVSQALMPQLWGTGCVHIGDACPAGDFPVIPPEVTGARLYVLEGSVAGDGSEGAPFATILEAVAAAASGDVIVVGAGTYTDPIVIDKPLTVWGACVERVKIVDTVTNDDDGTFTVNDRLDIRNLEITSSGMAFNQALAEGSTGLVATGIFIHHTTRRAILVTSGNSMIHDSLIFNINLGGPDLTDARGLQAYSITGAAAIEVENVIIEKVSAAIVSMEASTSINATHVLARNSFQGSATDGYPCFGAWRGAHLTGNVIAADQCTFKGIQAKDASAVVSISYGAVTDTRTMSFGASAGQLGFGMDAIASQLIADHVLVRNAFEFGIGSSSTGTTLNLSDVVVLDTQARPNSSGLYGWGLLMVNGPEVNLERGLFEGNRIHAEGESTQLNASHIAILHNLESDDGMGLVAMSGSRITLANALFEDIANPNIYVSDAQTQINMSDVLIHHATEEVSSMSGYGVVLAGGATGILERGVIDDVEVFGVQAESGSTLEAIDVIVSNTRPDDLTQSAGYGVGSLGGSVVSLTRAFINNNHFLGVGAQVSETAVPGEDPNLLLHDVIISDTHPSVDNGECMGHFESQGSVSSLTNVLIDRSSTVGSYHGPHTVTSATHLVIRDTMSGEDSENPGRNGWGLHVFDDAEFTGQYLLIEGSQDAGAVFQGAGPSSLTDILIRDTRIGECALYESTDPFYCLDDGQTPVSRALALMGPTHLTVTNFEFSDNGTLGFQLLMGRDVTGVAYTESGTLTLTDGGILGHEFGMCIEELPDYDLTTLENNVYLENDALMCIQAHAAPLWIIPPTQ